MQETTRQKPNKKLKNKNACSDLSKYKCKSYSTRLFPHKLYNSLAPKKYEEKITFLLTDYW